MKLRALFWAFSATQLLVSCGSDVPQQLPGKVVGKPPQAIVSPAASASADTARYVFDVPALLDLTADQIKTKLGKPVSDGQESIDEEINSLRYQRQGYDLSIDYEVESRRVAEYALNPHKDLKEPSVLLRAAHVTRNDKRYRVQYSKGENNVYNGLSIIPANARVLDQFGHWVPRDTL